jgi:hypothetical protein
MTLFLTTTVGETNPRPGSPGRNSAFHRRTADEGASLILGLVEPGNPAPGRRYVGVMACPSARCAHSLGPQRFRPDLAQFEKLEAEGLDLR